MFIIQNPGVIISFVLVFFQSVASFECFVFMALSVWIKSPYIEKCLFPTTPKPSCADTFPPIDCFSPVRGCNFGPILTLLVLPATFYRYCHVIRYALKSQILLFAR